MAKLTHIVVGNKILKADPANIERQLREHKAAGHDAMAVTQDEVIALGLLRGKLR